MKSSLRFLAAITATVLLLCGATISFTSCYQEPPTIIAPVDDVTTTQNTTIPTVAVPEHQLSIQDLMSLHGVEMPWSAIEGFEHEMTGENTAHFVVADNVGQECFLDVVIDFESGLLTEAILYYGDIRESILTNDSYCLLRVMYATNGQLS